MFSGNYQIKNFGNNSVWYIAFSPCSPHINVQNRANSSLRMPCTQQWSGSRQTRPATWRGSLCKVIDKRVRICRKLNSVKRWPGRDYQLHDFSWKNPDDGSARSDVFIWIRITVEHVLLLKVFTTWGLFAKWQLKRFAKPSPQHYEIALGIKVWYMHHYVIVRQHITWPCYLNSQDGLDLIRSQKLYTARTIILSIVAIFRKNTPNS